MTEIAAYQVLKKMGEAEIREYPAMILASTTVSSAEDNEAFGIIAEYIFGGNTARKQIAMTAPVITSEKIAMTAPVITGRKGTGFKMSFVMPSKYSMKTLPKPNSSKVRIEAKKARKIAVLRFSGFAGEKKVAKMQQKLLSLLKANKIKPKSAPFLMRYNAPWTLPFLRRNEIAFEV